MRVASFLKKIYKEKYLKVQIQKRSILKLTFEFSCLTFFSFLKDNQNRIGSIITLFINNLSVFKVSLKFHPKIHFT